MIQQLHTADALTELAEKSPKLVVCFQASWSRPCRLFTPALEQAAAEAPAGLAFACLDADGTLSEKYGVRSLPTLVYFRDGQPVRRSVGLQSAAGILEQAR